MSKKLKNGNGEPEVLSPVGEDADDPFSSSTKSSPKEKTVKTSKKEEKPSKVKKIGKRTPAKEQRGGPKKATLAKIDERPHRNDKVTFETLKEPKDGTRDAKVLSHLKKTWKLPDFIAVVKALSAKKGEDSIDISSSSTVRSYSQWVVRNLLRAKTIKVRNGG